MSSKVTYIVKTDINTDGRVLNQMEILLNYFPDLHIDLVLLPNREVTIELDKRIRLHSVNLAIRNNRFLRPLTFFIFLFKAISLLVKLKPNILHVHDTSVVLPALLYKRFTAKSLIVIYDDHELPYGNSSFLARLLYKAEKRLLRESDFVIFANEERMNLVIRSLGLDMEKCDYFLNLPSTKAVSERVMFEYSSALRRLDDVSSSNNKLIIHQGRIDSERGEEKLARLSQSLPENHKILLVGAKEDNVLSFLTKYQLNEEHFVNAGIVSYEILREFWLRASFSAIFYDPEFINNRLCAPNRLYLSAGLCIPAIVNKDNPVLSDFILKNDMGIFLEDINTQKDFEKLGKIEVKETLLRNLDKERTEDFVEIYKKFI